MLQTHRNPLDPLTAIEERRTSMRRGMAHIAPDGTVITGVDPGLETGTSGDETGAGRRRGPSGVTIEKGTETETGVGTAAVATRIGTEKETATVGETESGAEVVTDTGRREVRGITSLI
jgi:hypothetical protein